MDEAVEIETRGDVGRTVKAYAREKIGRLTRLAGAPVLYARVKLVTAPDPARERPALAQATFDVDGTPVRAHTSARDPREAIDLLERRLRDQLEHLAARREALRTRGPRSREAHEWRHGDAPTVRPPFFDRPVEEREVVRRKTFALHALTVEEAAEEMDRLDYDFHLFTCAENGSAAVVHRASDGGVALSCLTAVPSVPAGVAVDEEPAPTLDEAQAIVHLDLTGAPFVFYRDLASGLGSIVYRRYDGHYGLVTSVPEREVVR